MKKIFALILMSLAVCVNANAECYRNYFKADELREQEAYYANIYSCSTGRFICWSNSDRVRIECEDGIFHGATIYFTRVRIGLYKGDKLIELIKNADGDIPEGDYNHAYIDKSSCYVNGEFTGGYNIGYKIIHHLKYVGSVRIIATKYSGPSFDITIPMNPNIKTYIPKEEPQEPEPIVEEVSESTESTDTVKTIMVELPKIETPSPNVVLASNTCPIADNNTPQTDEIWKSYENAVRYIKYNDASYLERTYLKIESLLYANKREMRSLPKDSNELKLKKQQIKVMKSKMEEIDNKYFELTNKYIYQG